MSRLDRINNWEERGRLAHYHAGQLAKLCAVSESQLRRYFASEFHRAPQDWLDELRGGRR